MVDNSTEKIDDMNLQENDLAKLIEMQLILVEAEFKSMGLTDEDIDEMARSGLDPYTYMEYRKIEDIGPMDGNCTFDISELENTDFPLFKDCFKQEDIYGNKNCS